MTTFKALRGSASALLATLAVMGVITPSALGAEPHEFASISFGASGSTTFSNPNGIAIDESNGDVYVADIGTQTVYKFDASGHPIKFIAGAGIGTSALSGAETPAGSFEFPNEPFTPAAIAVDNSTSPADPSAEDLYVMDAGHHVIDKFNPAGEYLGQVTDRFTGELLGLGIDADGNVHVALGSNEIDVFDDSVSNRFVTSFVTHDQFDEAVPGHGFAVAPDGDAYWLFSCGCMEKVGGGLEPLGRVDNSSVDVAAAVDPSTGHLYIDDESFDTEWDTGGMNGSVLAAGNTLEDVGSGTSVGPSFGSMQLSGSVGHQGGVAVNGTSGNIYVSNPASDEVDIFSTTVPAVDVGTATAVTQTAATLNGTVDPRHTPITKCAFEYETSTSANLTIPITTYAHSVPCAQTPAQIGSGTTSVSVSANIPQPGLSALRPGVLYHFRLVVENVNGSSQSSGLFATTGPGFGVKAFEVSLLNQNGTPDTQAGSHPYKMVTNIAFNTKVLAREATADSRYALQPDGNVKDIITDLPPGLVGNPDATATKCTLAQLETPFGANLGGGTCPAESEVGELEVEFGDSGSGAEFESLKEPVYNMVAPHGVAAQIGANFVVPKSFINVGVLAGGDYPLQGTGFDLPVLEPVISIRLTVFGVVGGGDHVEEEKRRKAEEESGLTPALNPKPFLTLPTGCDGPLRSMISADSYQNPGQLVTKSSVAVNAAGEPVNVTGCSQLLFPPTIEVQPDVPNASSSSGLTVGVHVSQKAALNPDGLAESALRDTTVALPAGVAINPAGADGLEACSETLAGFEANEGQSGFEEFNPEFEPGNLTPLFTPTALESLQPGVSLCPNGSKIGTAKVKTPLLPNPLEGAVYLATQDSNPFKRLVAMYMLIEDPVSGSTIKLAGEVRLCESVGEVLNGVSCQAPGQIITTFANTPDLPFEELELHFFGGERAPLTTPSRCGIYTTQASFTPWDGNGPVNTSSSFQITSGPNKSPCPGSNLPFSPSLTAGSTNIQAGAFSPFTTTFSREDGQQSLQAISLKMPAGLSGLLSGVKLCGETEGNAGTCSPASQIGETTVSVGVGSDPFSVTGGKVYITGPYEGAPFGLSIVNPAVAGPFDLGKVVVRAKIEVDPHTADLTITTDNSGPYKIPSILDGIPLQIKHINVSINRPGFTFNPTNCDPMAVTGSLSSAEGARQALSVPFQATNCAALAFKPKLTASTSGKTSKAKGASLTVKLTYPKASQGTEVNIAKVKVDLPKQLPSRLTTLQKACVSKVFEANPASCPAASIVGHARAITPILPVPLEGPAYFVSHGGEAFPSLIVVLQGYGVTVDLVGTTFISKAGITSSTFKQVPDVPVGSFELTLPEGNFSALAANGNLCYPMKTVTVRKRVTERIHGHKRYVMRKVKQEVVAPLSMPTAFVGQSGAEIHESTPIGVTGCPKAKKAKTKKGGHGRKRQSQKKK
jgi:NHL repeat